MWPFALDWEEAITTSRDTQSHTKPQGQGTTSFSCGYKLSEQRDTTIHSSPLRGQASRISAASCRLRAPIDLRIFCLSD